MELLREIDDTFCIAVFGNFLGEASTGSPGRDASWIPRRATPDSVMDLLGFRPSVRIARPDGEASEEIRFSSLDGFRPESLFRSLGLFAPYREALDEARTERPSSLAADGGGLLDAILDVAEPETSDSIPRNQEELEDFVRAVVRPHLVRTDEGRAERVARAEELVSDPLSGVLHQSSFQELESIWRSLVFLLSRVETSGRVRVYAINAPREELAKDLLEAPDLSNSRLAGLLSAPSLGAPGRRWGLAVGAYGFGLDSANLDLLARIGTVARAARVPWLSSLQPASPGAGAESWLDGASAEWEALRRRPESASIALTYPRFLVREPYGEGGRLSKGLRYQEKLSSPDHLLWGHGAFLGAVLMAQGYAAQGWRFREEEWAELAGVPQAPSFALAEEPPISTEEALDLPTARRLLEAGVLPLLAFPARAAIRLGRMGSVSAEEIPLAAWWRK